MAFHKTTISVTVLTDLEEPYDPKSLADVAYDILDGDWTGNWRIEEHAALTPAQMAEECHKVGTDPEFFGLTDDGELLVEEE